MLRIDNRKFISIIFLLFLIVLVISIVLVNKWIESSLGVIKKEEPKKVVEVVEVVEVKKVEEPKIEIHKGGLVKRRSMLEPNRRFTENIITFNGVEVARYKNINDQVFEFEGEIPDGRGEFVNKTTDTYGEEYYLKGKRDGDFKEYYKNGQMRREAFYKEGKCIKSKEYFSDGILRLEEDLSDALWAGENKNRGMGKTYYRDGTLMYEWSLTNKGNGGYARSYNIKGKLANEKIFDAFGNVKGDKDILE
jgi:antitoxin component YwqK of YwqJK toxin-antitoxin module